MNLRSEKGQALTELIIVFPIFVVSCFALLALFAQQARSHIDKSSTLSLALAERPQESAEFVLNPSLLRKNSGGRENELFPDAAPIQKGENCDGRRALYKLNTNSTPLSTRVTLETCAPQAGYENQVRYSQPGTLQMKSQSETSPYEPRGTLWQKTRGALPFLALAKAPLWPASFVKSQFMNFDTHPIASQHKFVSAMGATKQMSVCLAELCRTAAEHPFCLAGGGIALLSTHFLQSGSPPGLCPLLESAVSARAKALHLAWRSRLTTLIP
jgi:hypothetical protein